MTPEIFMPNFDINLNYWPGKFHWNFKLESTLHLALIADPSEVE